MVKELHLRVLSAEDSGKLQPKQQHVGLRTALKGQGELANPFELIGAMEAMTVAPEGKAAAYSNVVTAFAQQGVSDDVKVKAITTTHGKSLSERLGDVARDLHDDNLQLAKERVDGVDGHLNRRDRRGREQRPLGDTLDYQKYKTTK